MPEEKKPKKEPKQVLVRMPEEWHEWLRKKAFDDRTSIADLVRDAVKEKFELSDPQERAALA